MLRSLPRVLAWMGMVVFVAACSAPPAPQQVEVVRPVKTLLIGAGDAGVSRRFPARIDAGRKAELAFRVPGTIQDIAVKEGDPVEQGRLIASLDTSDYQLVVNERQTTHENARKNYERGRELIDKGAISRKDFDQLEADFRNSLTALEAARQDLSYTELKAPFNGVVARRHVQRFEEVQAKQVVVELQDLAEFEVKFDVPERLIRGLRAAGDGPRARDGVTVSFDDRPDHAYPLTFREAATRADPATQTFEVTFSMPRPEDHTILPGMTASVNLDLAGTTGAGGPVQVPSGAVTGDVTLQPQVWVVDAQTMTVKPRSVKVGAMSGASIDILEGLAGGDRVVIAGAPFLVEGMKVTLMPEVEQAEPRIGE